VVASPTDKNNGVVRYFQGVAAGLELANSPYTVGVYGARHVCSIVSNNNLAASSFIGGLSTGWSGNLGYPLPTNWAFNQIQTVTLGTGTGQIQIDKNVSSGRNEGVSSLTVPVDPNAALFAYLDWLQDQAHAYNTSHSTAYSDDFLVLQYLRQPAFTGIAWDGTTGPVDSGFVQFIDAQPVARERLLVDPQYRTSADINHLAGGANGVMFSGTALNVDQCTLSDLTGWGGDLLQLLRAFQLHKSEYVDATTFAQTYINSPSLTLSDTDFGQTDMLQDASAFNIGNTVRITPSVNVAGLIYSTYRIGGTYQTRYTDFYQGRFGSNPAALLAAAKDVYTSQNALIAPARSKLLGFYGADAIQNFASADLNAIATVFSNTILALVSGE
jgi:peptidoglycan hydrolase-like protein with peptidoglycan-binding domain